MTDKKEERSEQEEQSEVRIVYDPERGEERRALTLQQAQRKLGISYTALLPILKRNNVRRFRLKFGKEIFVWEDDVLDLLTPQYIDEEQEA
uniref:Uncharacterized protein n=1 Tax=Thermosporothrix sp. COM3 TaxID=2490863 RepID=A0A455SVL8_9CHLR|nr:hypothetical protein KTC_48660 [Thermosporothrix sp. COM3]BBH90180.1 hypothetical protein KTC_49310 [Thermosporothrix sp. COM3]BBH90245.1 hypothetical protein KTC_49960 [Thermosporothrix sp. COM3]